MRIARLFSFLLLVFLAMSLAGCVPGFGGAGVPPTDTPGPEISGPRLRIINAGEVDIRGLVVLFPESRIEFGDIPAGAVTNYFAAPEGVFAYAAYQYLLDGEIVTQPVIDWVGESPKPGTDFTYTIVFRPQNPAMQRIELVAASVDQP